MISSVTDTSWVQLRSLASAAATPGRPGAPEHVATEGAADAQRGDRPATSEAPGAKGRQQELSEEERREVQELKRRDREVRAHEQAHLAAAGGYAMGGARYTYKMGPDGKRYAVGGEVPIDVSEVPGNPQATLQKAMTVRRAALAPSNPSAADRSIAAKASAMAAKARQEIARESGSAVSGESNPSDAQASRPTAANAGSDLEKASESNLSNRLIRGIQGYAGASAAPTSSMIELFA